MVVQKENEPSVFVVDRDSNTVVRLSLTLDLVATYQDPILKVPQGLDVICDSQVAICGRESNNIVLLDVETGKMTTLLDAKDGLTKPISVRFSGIQKRMFIGSKGSNYIKTYTFVALKLCICGDDDDDA